MPRKKVQREPCDCLDCREGFPAISVFGPAIARQQPPPKCLVMYVRDAFDIAQPLDDAVSGSLPVLDTVIDEGSSGLLAMRQGHDKEHSDLENLFCTLPVDGKVNGKGAEDRGSAIRNMSSMLVSDCKSCLKIGRIAGFESTQTLAQLGLDHSPTKAAHRIAEILEFQDLQQLDAPQKKKPRSQTDDTDLLFITLAGASTQHEDAATSHLQTVEGLLKELTIIPKFSESVMLVLLFRMRDTTATCFPGKGSSQLTGVKGYEYLCKPRQSFEFACLDEVQALLQQLCLVHSQHLSRSTLVRKPQENVCLLKADTRLRDKKHPTAVVHSRIKCNSLEVPRA